VLLSFEVGGGEVNCGVGGVGVRTGAGRVSGICDEGGGVMEVERDFSSGVSGRTSSVVGSSEGSMTSRATAVCGMVGVVTFVQQVREVCEVGACRPGRDVSGDRIRGACCGEVSRGRCDRDASDTGFNKRREEARTSACSW
jgi:hypothetical protein